MVMGFQSGNMGGEGAEQEERTSLLLPLASASASAGGGPPLSPAAGAPPKDRFHATYMVYFTLGAGFLLPWNAFITAVDYFSYLYPAAPVDRVFSVAYMVCGLIPLILIVGWWANRSSASLRINSGLLLFVLSLLVVPVMDAAYVRGRRGLYTAYDVTVAAVVLSGVADALVQSGVIGAAGELPTRYMQAVAAGTAASGCAAKGNQLLIEEDNLEEILKEEELAYDNYEGSPRG